MEISPALVISRAWPLELFVADQKAHGFWERMARKYPKLLCWLCFGCVGCRGGDSGCANLVFGPDDQLKRQIDHL